MSLASCTLSTVKNTSGVTKYFGFLGVHGRQLAANEEFSQFGNILESIQKEGPVSSKRLTDSFRGALERGDLDIVETPSIFLFDENDDATKVLKLDNGDLYASDACWDTPVSSAAL